jgi:hypothetical protein
MWHDGSGTNIRKDIVEPHTVFEKKIKKIGVYLDS